MSNSERCVDVGLDVWDCRKGVTSRLLSGNIIQATWWMLSPAEWVAAFLNCLYVICLWMMYFSCSRIEGMSSMEVLDAVSRSTLCLSTKGLNSPHALLFSRQQSISFKWRSVVSKELFIESCGNHRNCHYLFFFPLHYISFSLWNKYFISL